MSPVFSVDETKLISDAAEYLEHPTLLMRLANSVGKPLEYLVIGAKKIAPGLVEDAVNSALKTVLKVAMTTIPAASLDDGIAAAENINDVGSATSFWHTMSVIVMGTAGGLFGAPGLVIELPITTTIMFRSIASIAKEFGENLDHPDVRLQCLAVFCLGGPGKDDDEMESAYLTAKFAMQAKLAHAVSAVAGKTAEELVAMIQKGSAPAVVSFLGKIASRFNITVTEKLVAQTIPVLGAVTGAIVNAAFMDHFNRVARFHFAIRLLERNHGVELVEVAYRDAMAKTKRSGRKTEPPAEPDMSATH